MTEQEKQLLIKDLCARLPYGVKLKIGEYSDYCLHGIIPGRGQQLVVTLNENGMEYNIDVSVKDVKPYLRPMSSMTEDEKEEYTNLFDITVSGNYDVFAVEAVDWFNKHMFDIRNLLEKGLALEAKAEMYK